MGDPYPGKIKFEGGRPWVISYEAVVASLALGDWPAALWPKAAAVIAAESNRTVNIYNTYKEGHYGLMQISKSAHPGLFQRGGILWMHPVLNCGEGYRIYREQGWGAWQAASEGRHSGYLLQATAATKVVQSKIRGLSGDARSKALYALYGKRDGEAFMQLLEGAALSSINKSLGDASGAAGKAIGDTIEASGAAVVDAAANIQSNSIFGAVTLLLGAGKWISDPSNWLRVGQVVIGGGLLLAGISIAAKPVTAAAAKGVAKVTPVGRAASKAVKSVGKAAA